MKIGWSGFAVGLSAEGTPQAACRNRFINGSQGRAEFGFGFHMPRRCGCGSWFCVVSPRGRHESCASVLSSCLPARDAAMGLLLPSPRHLILPAQRGDEKGFDRPGVAHLTAWSTGKSNTVPGLGHEAECACTRAYCG